MTGGESFDSRLLVLMPTSRDAERTVMALAKANITCFPCTSLHTLCAEIKRGAGAALLTEEAMLNDRENCLEQVLHNEPPWSNFPLIVLTRQDRNIPHLSEEGKVTFTLVERPIRFATLRSVVESALRHRHHQYEIRDTLLDLTKQTEALRASEQQLRQARYELELANRQLEERVEQRTKKLEETVSDLEAFSYSISHDLRAPLRSMEGYAAALTERYSDRLDQEGRRYLERISAGAARLDILVQDVLAYSRVAKGDIRLENVDVNQVVRDVIETYPQLKEKESIHVPSPLPLVRAHPAYLTQCVANLLGNAVKFVRPGIPPHVIVRAESEGDPHTVRIWFEDNGIGIAPEHFKQIFEIFGRVHPAKAYEGTGIGLAIVRKAAERMGGAVGLTSELGKGTRFWLSLPKAYDGEPGDLARRGQ